MRIGGQCQRDFFGIFGPIFLMAGLVVLTMGLGCSSDDDQIFSSRSYKGHASDADSNNFVRVYPATVGTRLDDCQTCHTNGEVTEPDKKGGRKGTFSVNPCDYCHYYVFSAEYPGWTGLPESYQDTLNPYGLAYKNAGRSQAAIRTIRNEDSDNDSFTNDEEIADLRYPGDDGSYPGLPICPSITVTRAELQAMPQHTQFGLANTTKQQFDYYATYTGVKITDILEAEGIDLDGAESVDILAPDGFAKTFTIDEVTQQYPDHRFWAGLGVDDFGTDCAFVEYPGETYGLADGVWIGTELGHEQWHIIAYKREGADLEESYLDPSSGKINGEGPFRNIIPPGSVVDEENTPDRGKYADTSGCPDDGWDYDFDKDHNAGNMVKGAVIIEIEPMPEGCETFDIQNGGWGLVDAGELLIYGHNVTAD